MGTRKIYVAVNKRVPHRNPPCDRLWAAVCGRSTTAKVSAHCGYSGGGKGQFRGSILQQDKAVAPPRITPARRADREDGETATFTCSRSVFGKLAWLRFWASAPRLAPCLQKSPAVEPFSMAQKWLL